MTFWPDLDLTLVKSKLWWRHRVRWPPLSISTCKMTHKLLSYGMLIFSIFSIYLYYILYLFYRISISIVFYYIFYRIFSSDHLWPDLDLDLFRYDLCTHAVFFSDISTFVSFSSWLPVYPTLQPQMWKQCFFTFDLTLTLYVTFILRCQTWIRCVLMGAFERRLACLATTTSFRDDIGAKNAPPPVNGVCLRSHSMPG